MKLSRVFICMWIVWSGIAVADSDPAQLQTLAFMIPASDSEGSFDTLTNDGILKVLETRTGIGLLDSESEINGGVITARLLEAKGDLIGFITQQTAFGSEVESWSLYPVMCRETAADGTVVEKPADVEDTPGLHLIATPGRDASAPDAFSLAYKIDVGMISDQAPMNGKAQDRGCPGLIRYEFNDRIDVSLNRWQVVSIIVMENSADGGLYEVWVMIRLSVP